MALILRLSYQVYQDLLEKRDPRTQNFPLLGSPIPILVILGTYLYFVKSIGPKWMQNRQPYNLQSVINVYNFLQIIINFYLGTFVSEQKKMASQQSILQCSVFCFFFFKKKGLYWSYLQPDFSLKCQPIDRTVSTRNTKLLQLCYGFLLSRMFDLFDTVSLLAYIFVCKSLFSLGRSFLCYAKGTGRFRFCTFITIPVLHLEHGQSMCLCQVR